MKMLERIMLIDDDSNTNFYNKLLIEQSNLAQEIVVFQNAKEALSHLENSDDQIDIIFLDINMPIMNGWQFIEAYEQEFSSDENSRIVVMLTSSVNTDDKKNAENFSSVSRFINKPMLPELLNEILVSHLALKD